MRTTSSVSLLAGMLVTVAVAATWIYPRLIPLEEASDWKVRHTARVAVAAWFVAMTGILGQRSWARSLWTVAAGAYFIHVAVAFEYAHHWSHQKAFDHVQDISGFGPGILVSYGFTLLWLVDVLWWWLASTSYQRRPRPLTIAILAFMTFIVFNGTVVYETGLIRYVSLLGFGWLGMLLMARVRTRPETQQVSR